MISLLVASALAFIIVIFATPVAIRYLRRNNIGQFIQSEVEGHMHKQGVPTMGGVVIVVGVLIGFLLAHLKVFTFGEGLGFTATPIELPEGAVEAMVKRYFGEDLELAPQFDQ